MSSIIPLRPAISKAAMRKATDDAHLHVEYFGDAVREVSFKIAAIGYFCRPKHRAEFLRVMRFIETELPLDLESIRALNVCLDLLRERFEA
jgi:hypothetical protein